MLINQQGQRPHVFNGSGYLHRRLLMPVVMLSGMLFPVESMPQILQWLAAVVPPRYYISAMRKLMIMGVGITEVTQEVAVLSAMTVLFLAIALKKFNTRLE